VASTVQLDELRRASRHSKLKVILPPHRAATMLNNMQRATVLDVLPPLPHAHRHAYRVLRRSAVLSRHRDTHRRRRRAAATARY